MLRRYNIQEVKKILDDTEEVNQFLAENWLLLDMFRNGTTVSYILVRPQNCQDETT